MTKNFFLKYSYHPPWQGHPWSTLTFLFLRLLPPSAPKSRYDTNTVSKQTFTLTAFCDSTYKNVPCFKQSQLTIGGIVVAYFMFLITCMTAKTDTSKTSLKFLIQLNQKVIDTPVIATENHLAARETPTRKINCDIIFATRDSFFKKIPSLVLVTRS